MAYLDADGRFRFANAAFACWFGRPPPEGSGLHEGLGPAAAGVAELLPAALAGEPQEWKGTLPGSGVDGAREVTVTLIPDPGEDGRAAGVVLIAHDVSVRQRAERAQDARRGENERLRDVFLAMLGHDLRNPLNTITLSASTLLRHETLNEAERRSLARIAASAERMRRMIEQLLDFTRNRIGGGVPIVRTACDLGELCRQVVEEIGVVHPDRPLALTTSGDLAGEWDRDRLGEAISNLVANAVEHGHHGTPVTVELHGANRRVTLAVHNRSEAIPGDVLGVLFDPLLRPRGVDGPRQPRKLGLGLYITKQVVEAHGGRVDVESGAGETVFRVELPR